MTSNIGAAEMSSLVSPKLGFQVSKPDDGNCAPSLAAKLSRAGLEAAPPKVHAGVFSIGWTKSSCSKLWAMRN